MHAGGSCGTHALHAFEAHRLWSELLHAQEVSLIVHHFCVAGILKESCLVDGVSTTGLPLLLQHSKSSQVGTVPVPPLSTPRHLPIVLDEVWLGFAVSATTLAVCILLVFLTNDEWFVEARLPSHVVPLLQRLIQRAYLLH